MPQENHPPVENPFGRIADYPQELNDFVHYAQSRAKVAGKRKVCPDCGRDVAIARNGSYRRHYVGVVVRKVCPGSGKPIN